MSRNASKSSLFLIEIIVAILFLALTGANCVRMFAKAHTLSQRSTDLGSAILYAQNAAESFRSVDGDFDRIIDLTGGTKAGETINVFYDSEWGPATSTSWTYRLTMVLHEDGGLRTANIYILRFIDPQDQPLYEIQAACYAG